MPQQSPKQSDRRQQVTLRSPSLPLTILSVPKPFHGHIGIIQRNAVQSWLCLEPRPEVILCGNEVGMAEIAEELNILHLSDVACNSQGTPLLDDVFAQVHHLATHEILVYLNADIILTQDFPGIVQQVASQHQKFLILGRRWNLEINQAIDFQNPRWEAHLLEDVYRKGIFGGIGALDYFAFPKPLFSDLPPFAVGRAGWDSWMVGEALKQKYSVVNVSQVIRAIHQNHDYRHLAGQRLEAFHGLEAKQNRAFLKDHIAGNSTNATVYLTPQVDISLPRVSLVVAANHSISEHAIELERVIEAIQQQTNVSCELILVGPMVAGRSIQWQSQVIRMQQIACDAANTVTAWNEGLKKAQGELVLFLDASSWLLPNALADLIAQFETGAGSLEMVFAGWQQVDPETGAVKSCEPWQSLAHLLAGREGVHGFHLWILPMLWDLLHPSTVLFRRDWLVDFGTLNSGLSPHAAIIDKVLHLSSKGAAAVYLEKPVLHCLASKPLTSGEVAQIGNEVEQILIHFFARSHLPDWMWALKAQANYSVCVWLAWLTYQTDDFHGMVCYLRRSLQGISEPTLEVILDWIQQFENFAQLTGQSFEVDRLLQSPVWQDLVHQVWPCSALSTRR